jgi:hypothetical protein
MGDKPRDPEARHRHAPDPEEADAKLGPPDEHGRRPGDHWYGGAHGDFKQPGRDTEPLLDRVLKALLRWRKR